MYTGQHEYGVKERPSQPHHGAFVTASDFAPGHLEDELAIAPEAFGQRHERGGLGGVRVDGGCR